jgi:NAD(P)H-dependent FMN reductase
MTRIGIVVGSTRPGRKAATVAAWVYEHSQERSDATFELVDLADYDLPLLDEPVPPSLGDYRGEHTRRWADTVARFDGFVFVTPEYNHGPPAALKNALDYLFAEWNDKASGFVGYGSAGGTRAVEQLRLAMGELRVADVRSQVSLSLFDDFEDMQTFAAPRPHQVGAVRALLDDVTSWSRAMRSVREAG